MLADIARFFPDDPEALVSAALACPVCLRSERVSFTAVLEGYDPQVECVCPSCRERWLVYLNSQQALRFGLLTVRPGC